jgi:hypothetical protein
MLLESDEAPDLPDRTLASDGHSPGGGVLSSSIQDDVERLIQIAAQLFGAIERQIHRIEQDLNYSQGKRSVDGGQIVFKEQLIRTASNLETSLQEIVVHLGERADRARMTFATPEVSYTE